VPKFVLVIRNRVNELAALDKLGECYGKGDTLDAINPGQSPGKGILKRTCYSYAEVDVPSKASLNNLINEQLLYPQLDADGRRYKMKSMRRYHFPNSVIDTMSKNWKNPTPIDLSKITLNEKAS